MWQLCNWTRLDDDAYQRFCLMSSRTLLSACFLICMILGNNSRKNTHLTTRVFALSCGLLFEESSCPAADIPAFSEGVLICYMRRIPPSVAHCLPLCAPVTARSVVWFVLHRSTLHKRGLSPQALDKDPNCDLQTLKSSRRAACPEEAVVKIGPRVCD